MADALDIARAKCLEGVRHGFFGRRGGVSIGASASLNCGLGSADDPAAVAENRRRAAEAILPGAALVGLYQVHSATCVTVAAPWRDDDRPQADALVTDQPGVLLGILTADCAPVLLADRVAGVIGAAHAGWKGALAGVTDQTVAAMEALGASRHNIRAAIGPCIAAASYEVDEIFRDRFVTDRPDNTSRFAPGRPGHWQFDLASYIAKRLEMQGVGGAEILGLDTYEDSERYYSFRRAVHAGEADYGRQLSLIGLD